MKKGRQDRIAETLTLGKRGLLLMQYMYVLITRTRGLKVNDLNISVTVIVGNRSRDYFYRQLKTLI